MCYSLTLVTWPDACEPYTYLLASYCSGMAWLPVVVFATLVLVMIVALTR